MKKNKHIMGGFVACLHCLLIAIPLFVLIYQFINIACVSTFAYDNDGNFLRDVQSWSFGNTITGALENSLNQFNVLNGWSLSLPSNSWSNFYQSNYNAFPFLMSNDFMSVFALNGASLSASEFLTYAYINFYLNWIINMSVIVFIPEIIILFFDFVRKLVYSFSHKINGGF